LKLVINSYDLEIDKQCRIYEHSLNDANTNMKKTVRNAQAVLQKARLVVAQEKNQYDMRGCVTALDSCMQDEFVCGTDYDNCLDPTGKYIVNGEVVVGSLPKGGTQAYPTGLYKAWNYKDSATSADLNAWEGGTVGAFINETAGNLKATENMSGFLQSKIGRNEDGKNYGMCISVLNKCQDISYDKNTKKYKVDNDTVRNYLQRTLVQIKARQDTVLAEYGENCVINLRNCLSSNGAIIGYGVGSMGTISAAMVSACGAMLNSCVNITGDTKESLVSGAVCYAGTRIASLNGSGPFTCAQ
jgi:hypothetical protein